MNYTARFSNTSIEKKFQKFLLAIPDKNTREAIIERIERLQENPRPFGEKPFKQLTPPVEIYELVAQYRIRIGDYRVLYDVDDKRKIVWILDIRKRSEGTYR